MNKKALRVPDDIGHMRHKPRQIRLGHGDAGAKEALRKLLSGLYQGMEVVVG